MSRRGDRSTAAARDDRWWWAVAGGGPFGRLVLVHAVTGAADAAFTVSLAGSLFLSVSVDAARPRILVYLLCTLAPFAVVVPVLAPFVDRFRGGYRAIIIATGVGRAVVCLLMANHLTTLFFFPAAFAVLVLGKTYSIAKSALVPRLVADPRSLVAANARMARVSTVGGLLGGLIGVLVLRVVGPPAVVLVAALGQACAAVLATRIPRPAAAPPANPVVDVAELTSVRLGLAASATSIVRFSVGFVTFLLALSLKTASEPAWVYGVVLIAGVVGGFLGAVIGPLVRRWIAEEMLLTAALAASGVLCLLAAPQDRRSSAILVSWTIGVAAAVAHQAFDSITQRLAPDAEKGRAFARFETRFQLAWVAGAVGPVLARPSGFVGLLVIGLVLSAGALVYLMTRRALSSEPPVPAASDTTDPVEALVALARALQSQGAPGLAVLTAVEAVRVASTSQSSGDGTLPVELSDLWLHVSHGGVASDAEVTRALELAEQVRDARQRDAGPATPPEPGEPRR
jgi:predicted MFS family arabinose efflux permease